jgi:monoterpene epsilon-lactone hydrolase
MVATAPIFRSDGSVDVPAFRLPPSDLLSAEAAAVQRARADMPAFDTGGIDVDIVTRRAQINAYMAPQIEALKAAFRVEITESEIGGVRVLDVTPVEGGHDRDRVLINLHGGAFIIGWPGVALIESIPIAAMARVRVVTVDYRMAPEHRHPAGVEDAAKVYTALLEQYAPGRIGIYGGSAGGVLTAQTAAWLPAHGLPQAGAIGIFGAGAVPFHAGESMTVAGYIDGSFPPPRPDGEPLPDIAQGYFTDAGAHEPSAWPGYHPDIMATFPPTLIITGTRAMDLSPAIYTNSQLLKAGIAATLIVGEGMGHCYHYRVEMPEGRDACAQIVAHFRRHLAQG